LLTFPASRQTSNRRLNQKVQTQGTAFESLQEQTGRRIQTQLGIWSRIGNINLGV